MIIFPRYLITNIVKIIIGDYMKKFLFLIIIFNLFLIGCTADSTHNYRSISFSKFNHVSLVAVGDNLIHESVYQSARNDDMYDFKPMLTEIKAYISNFDLKFINQEAILGGKEIGLSTYPCFNSPFELGDALVDTGFNLISVANNHTLDRGEKAVLNSINYWEGQPVMFSGSKKNNQDSHVILFDKNKIKFAFVAYTYGTNGIPHPNGKEYLVNVYSNQLAKRDLEDLKDLVDVIIVSMHWGDEYQQYPNETQKQQAKYLSNLGVDIIIGHHPHVIQPIDMLENDKGEQTFVIYSLGNFLSDQQGIDRLIGMAVSINIYKSFASGEVIILLDQPEAKLLYRYKDYLNNFSVLLFQNLNNSLLEDYQIYHEDKKNVIQYYYPSIDVS